MNTFSEMWGVRTPQEAIEKINEQRQEMAGKDPQNLEVNIFVIKHLFNNLSIPTFRNSLVIIIEIVIIIS